MHQLRKVAAASALVAGLTVLAGQSSDVAGQEKRRPFANPETLFKLGDANNDGKLTLDEFKKLLERGPRAKDNPKIGDFLFNRLDADSDSKLTLDEFKKLSERGAGFGKSKGKFLPKGPSAPKKDQPRKEGPKSTVNEKPTAEQLAFFEKKIRPVLVNQCYECHSEEAKKEKGGLVLDSRDGIRKGGDNGPAVIPGRASESLLLKAIRQTDKSLKMPPKSKLSEEVVADFERWIASGAADPRDGQQSVAATKEINIEKGRLFWSFQPPKATPVPAPKDADWAKSDVDRYLLAALEAKGLRPVDDADPRSLVRRIYFDLIGLPPTPEDVEAFYQSAIINRQSAIEAVIDKLLTSPRFGETWGRHWLDVARFAESSGKAANMSYPHAWRYRDYVIDAYNADKPFDRFIKEQIAGDLLAAGSDREKAQNLIATGFLAIGPKSHNEMNRRQFEMDLIDEQIDTTTQAFLGLTIACARCHDHKFDPIPQKDYYALAGIFRSSETCYGTVRTIQSNFPSPLIQLPANCGEPGGLATLSTARREAIEKQISDLREQISKAMGRDGFINTIGQRIRLSNLQSQVNMFEKDGTPKLQAMGVRERFQSMDTPLLIRGEVDRPGDVVPRGFPKALTTKQPRISGSGRKQLADWIASKDNPLTARVYVNRVWQHLFGRGLVATPENFGSAGQRPSNRALLDHLAVWFVDNGWSTKKLVRHLVTSHAYQLATTFDAKNHEADPDNALVWRMTPRRIEAEKVRDSMLAIAGQLDLEPPHGSDLMRNGEGSANFAFRFNKGPLARPDVHRSVYMTIIRDQLPESLTLFDFPDPNNVAGERATTNVPAQALYLLNNPFVIRQSEAAADRLLASSGTDEERVKRAYETFFARPPSEKEVKGAMDFVKNYSQRSTKRNTWAAFTQALFASAEFANLR